METQTCQSHFDLNFGKGKIANLSAQIIFINLIGWFPSPQMRGKRKDVESGEQGGRCHARAGASSWLQEKANLASGSNYVNCARSSPLRRGHLREVEPCEGQE